MPREVWITGMGMVTALGADLNTSWSRALAGKSGIRAISSFEADEMPVAGAGEVEDIELESLRERLPGDLAERLLVGAPLNPNPLTHHQVQ